ncbi:MAG: YraN family protein [Parcubacteria group bacterium]
MGTLGEDLAVKYLKKQGYKILHKNWYNFKGKRLGEIDIVAQAKDGEIVFVEVKTRVVDHVQDFVLPEEQITQSKLRKMQRVAECYVKSFDLWQKNWRMDAISVIIKDGKVHNVTHIKNIYF